MTIDIADIYNDTLKTIVLEKSFSFIPAKHNFHGTLFFRAGAGICIVDLSIDDVNISYLRQFPYSLITSSDVKDKIYILRREEVYKYELSTDRITDIGKLGEMANTGSHHIISSQDGTKLLAAIQIFRQEETGIVTKHIYSKTYFQLFETTDMSTIGAFYLTTDYHNIDLSSDGLTLYGFFVEVKNGLTNTVIDTIDGLTGELIHRKTLHNIIPYDLYIF